MTVKEFPKNRGGISDANAVVVRQVAHKGEFVGGTLAMERKGLSLVTVGIPTYNRAAGLRRTLEFISRQSYKNLEIIVSDNCSPNSDTESVVRHFMGKDPRIIYFRQSENRGFVENFLFVLEKASGEYFMWAADDDEWEPDFVSRCLAAMSGVGSVMCEFNTVFRATNRIEKNPLPQLGISGSAYADALEFINLMQPSLAYGLHRRTDILYVLEEKSFFEFYDCCIVLKQILGPGFRTIPGVSYSAGIDDAEYQIKTLDPTSPQLHYWPFARRSLSSIFSSTRLNVWQKLALAAAFLRMVARLYVHHERARLR